MPLPFALLWLRTGRNDRHVCPEMFFLCGSAWRLPRFHGRHFHDDECSRTRESWEITLDERRHILIQHQQRASARGASSNVGEEHKIRRTGSRTSHIERRTLSDVCQQCIFHQWTRGSKYDRHLVAQVERTGMGKNAINCTAPVITLLLCSLIHLTLGNKICDLLCISIRLT